MEARSGTLINASRAGAAISCEPETACGHLRAHRAVFLGLLLGLAVWCGVDVARRARVDPAHPGLHMTDFTVYTEAGRAFFDGRDPYEVSNIRGWKYLYPPLFALLVAPLAGLAPPWQAAAWFALSSVMAFGCYFECRALWRALDLQPGSTRSEQHSQLNADRDKWLSRWIARGALLAVLFPALNCLQRGQMGIALVYMLLLGLRLALLGSSRRGWFAAGLMLSLPVALKLTPALPAAALLVLLGMRGWCQPCVATGPGMRPFVWTACGATMGAAIYFLLLPAALVGWQANLRHLATWHARVASKVNDVRTEDFGGHVTSMRNQSLANALYRFGNWCAAVAGRGPDDLMADVPGTPMPMDAAPARLAVNAARWLYLPPLALCLVLAARRRDPWELAAAFSLACAATLVVAPVARGHYYVFWLPALLFVPGLLARQGRSGAAILLGAAPPVLSVGHYVWLDGFGRIGVLGIGTAVWVGASLFLMMKAPRHLAPASRDPMASARTESARRPARDLARRTWARWTIYMLVVCATVLVEEGARSVTQHYARAAQNWLAQKDLYTFDGRGFLYFPQAAMLYAPWLKVPQVPRELLWRCMTIGLFAAGLERFCRLVLKQEAGRLFAWVSLVSMPLAWSCGRNGQTTLALAGALLLAIASLSRGQLWRSAALITLAAAFKPLGAVVGLLACCARRGLWYRLAAMLLLAAGLPFLFAEPRYAVAQYEACFSMLAAAMQLGTSRPWAQFFGLTGTAGLWIAPELQLALRMLAAAGMGLLIRRFSRRLPPDRAAYYLYALSMLYLLLFNPRTENNSYAMLGPALGVALFEAAQARGSSARAVVLALVGLGALGSYELGRLLHPGARPIWLAPAMALVFTADVLWRLAAELRQTQAVFVPPMPFTTTVAMPGFPPDAGALEAEPEERAAASAQPL